MTKICKNGLSCTIAFDMVDKCSFDKCYQEKRVTEEKGVEKARRRKKKDNTLMIKYFWNRFSNVMTIVASLKR